MPIVNVAKLDPSEIPEIVELAKLALLIPADPERLLLVNPLIVFEPAAIVLFVNVSEPARVAKVPVVGRVTEVLAVAVKVVVYAPEVVKFPPSVIVLEPLLTPVPPYVGDITEPTHVPLKLVAESVPVEEFTLK